MYARALFAIALATFLPFSEVLLAQDRPNPEIRSSNVVLVNLSTPAYPPLARQTHIAGDVRLLLKINADGGINDIEAVSGHPLLRQSALDSARLSKFDCSHCSADVNPSYMVYTFEVRSGDCCAPTAEQFPKVLQSQNHITVVERSVCTSDPVATIIRVRSIKCLYLWHCSVR